MKTNELLKRKSLLNSFTPRPHYAGGGFILKTHQMFSIHATPEEFKHMAITGHFGFMFAETLVREIA